MVKWNMRMLSESSDFCVAPVIRPRVWVAMLVGINGVFLAAAWSTGLLGPLLAGSLEAYYYSLASVSALTLVASAAALRLLELDAGGALRNWSENLPGDIRLGLLLFAAELSLTMLLQWLWSFFGEPPQDKAAGMVRLIAGRGAMSAAVMVFVVCVLTPVAEELFYKRLLYAGVRRQMGAIKAILLCSAVFALSHSVQAAVLIFPGSLISHYAYERFQRLPANIVMHSLINSAAVAAAFL